MGALMAENGGRQLGMIDQLSDFLIKIRLHSSSGLTDGRERAMFWSYTMQIRRPGQLHLNVHVQTGDCLNLIIYYKSC